MSQASDEQMSTTLLESGANPRPLDSAELQQLSRCSFPPSTGTYYRQLDLDGATAYLAPGRELGPDVRVSLTIGVFDGYHQGHQRLIQETLADAKRRSCASAILSFNPDPASVLGEDVHSSELFDFDDRRDFLLSARPDILIVVDFNETLAATSYQSFFYDILKKWMLPLSLHVGSNFRLGVGGKGTLSALRTLGLAWNMEVFGHDLVANDAQPISATRIRTLVHAGKVEEAAQLLGRFHYVRGQVKHGRGEGRSLGFPTANVHVSDRSCLPAEGVYAGLFVVDNSAWPAAINVGAPPSFDSTQKALIEAHLLGFSGDLYERSVALIFWHHIRPSRSFDRREELIHTVQDNIKWVQTMLGTQGVEVTLDDNGRRQGTGARGN